MGKTKKKKKKVKACIDPVKRDRHLWNKFGRTLKEYEDIDKEQDHKCAICRRPPKNLPLANDHWHKLATLKVKSAKTVNGLWRAWNIEFDRYGYHLDEGHLSVVSSVRKKA